MRAVSQMQQTQTLLSERQAQMVSAIEQMAQHADQHTQLLRDAFGGQNERLDRQMNEQQKIWQEQALNQTKQLELLHQQWQVQALQNQKARHTEWAHWTEVQNAGLQQIAAFVKSTQSSVEQLRQIRSQESESQQKQQQQHRQQHEDLTKIIESASSTICREVESRSETLARVDAMLRENQFRNEQVVQLLSQAVQQASRTSA